jgi:2-amino-4-hydroxy-6-hydroxymethyldihydropteridine diphosphokinase
MIASRIFFGLGSNLGNRAKYLAEARQRLNDNGAIELVAASSLYETAPVGVIAQPAFLNQVIEARSALTPEALLDAALKIEHELGRIRRERWGPRTIDLDLLCFGGVVQNSRRLILPHPQAHRRRFVLTPWAEIAAEFYVPSLRRTVADLLSSCPDHSPVHSIGLEAENHGSAVLMPPTLFS